MRQRRIAHGCESSLSLRRLGLPEGLTTLTSLNRRDATGSSRLCPWGCPAPGTMSGLSARKDDCDYVCDRGMRHYTDRVLRMRVLRGREYKWPDITTTMAVDGHQSSPGVSHIETTHQRVPTTVTPMFVFSTRFASTWAPLLCSPLSQSPRDIQSRVMSVPTQMRSCHHWRPLTTSNQAGLHEVIQWELVLLRVQVQQGTASKSEQRKQYYL